MIELLFVVDNTSVSKIYIISFYSYPIACGHSYSNWIYKYPAQSNHATRSRVTMKHCGVVLRVLVLLGCVLSIHNGLAMEEEGLCSSSAYDYGDALGKAILFFQGQRSGKLPSRQRVKWRGDSALSDGHAEKV